MKTKKALAALVMGVALLSTAAGCSATRQIDPAETGSFRIEGTSWYGFCQGRNAFIWVPSKTDSEPDELEAVIYDDFRCVGSVASPKASSKPDTDPDGVVDDDD